jgi:predicted amidohydrolase
MQYSVAAVQYEPRFADKEYNVARLLELTEQAARAGARLVVLPEMATTGYCFRNRAEIAPLVEPVPAGPTVSRFSTVAATYGLHVVVGMAEVEPTTGAYYNTAVLIGPEGYIGKYRKTHSFVDETRWARDGDLGIPVFETALGRIAMLICMDATFFETARVAALAGADLIAFPTNWLGHQGAWRARAQENGVYMVCANRWGEERSTRFCGNSAVIDPAGLALNLLSTGDGLALAEVDMGAARTARAEALARRRPVQYQDLLIHSYLWHWKSAHPDLPAGRPVAVAAGEAPVMAHLADQVRWADKRARDRGWAGLDLVVFPCLAEQPDTGALAEVARTLGCHVVWGTAAEGETERAWLLGPDGLVGEYAAGGETAVFDLSWGRLALLTGSDLLVPEAFRLAAKRGADLIAVPACTERISATLRALENETPVAFACRSEGSRIVRMAKPHNVAAEAPGDMALALVDTSLEVSRTKETLRMLQPRWYEPLVRP